MGKGKYSPAQRGKAKTAKKRRGKLFAGRGNGSHPALNEVQKLYEFMQQNRLETLEFNKDDMHVRLVRQSSGRIPVPVNITAPAVEYPRQAHHEAVHDTMRAPVVPIKGSRIKSSITGIFYRAPSPSSPPFVKEGDTIRAGQVVCVIEAMKVFNEVKAETDCTILKVLVENGKPVTANHDLFVIKKK